MSGGWPGPGARLPVARPAIRPFRWTSPDRQLDHILLRGDFGRVAHSEAPALPLSDHRALVVDLTFD